jgi:FkbM family methyltransferase
MANRALEKFLDSFGHRKVDLLRLHSRVRALVKKARRRLSHGRSFRFHQALINEGDLVFDIGANVGEMTELYLELGARVVAVEPQEECSKILENRFGRHPGLTVVTMAVGAVEGPQEIMLSDIRSPISSMSEQWIRAVKGSGRFPYYEWSRSVMVPVTTLNSLIAKFGEPDFCKIDVEGFEQEVLKGLSRPLARLSFEFHAELLQEAIACLGLIRGIGEYRFNYTLENRMVLESPRWVDEDTLCSQLRSLPFASIQGDVYACLHASPYAHPARDASRRRFSQEGHSKNVRTAWRVPMINFSRRLCPRFHGGRNERD